MSTPHRGAKAVDGDEQLSALDRPLPFNPRMRAHDDSSRQGAPLSAEWRLLDLERAVRDLEERLRRTTAALHETEERALRAERLAQDNAMWGATALSLGLTASSGPNGNSPEATLPSKSVELVASGLASLDSLMGFLCALQRLPQILEVKPVGFSRGIARLLLRFPSSVPFMIAMIDLEGYDLQLVSIEDDRVEVVAQRSHSNDGLAADGPSHMPAENRS